MFSSQFIDDFLLVNGRKNCQDHETNKTNKDFWISASLTHNSFTETVMDAPSDGNSIEADEKDDDDTEKEFCTLVVPDGDINLTQLVDDEELNLGNVDQFQTEAFRKKIMFLFKIQQTIIKNMKESGSCHFVETAMKFPLVDHGISVLLLYEM
jgi:hypothetical protein